MENNLKGKFLPLLAIGLAFILIVPPVFGNSQEPHVSVITKNGLQLTLETDKFEYREGEIVNIRWNVTNISSEVIKYETRDTCDDGLYFTISSTEEVVRPLLPAGALLIPENDLRIMKFDGNSFYGTILDLVEKDPTREVAILIITGDKDGVEDVLRKNHGVTKIGKGQILSFVTAKVQAKEIPKIADYTFVHKIGAGGGLVCGQAIGIDFLTPGEFVDGHLSWSQLVPYGNQWEAPKRVSEGHYLIETEFNGVANCLVIELVGSEPLSQKSTLSCQNLRPPLDQDKETVLSTILPKWLKNNAKWWADGQIDDESFVNGLQYMIEEKIIHIPIFDVKKDATDKSLPPWIKNNAKWWAEGLISEREFITGMKYLVENGIIRIS